MKTPCLCPSEGHKYGGGKVTYPEVQLRQSQVFDLSYKTNRTKNSFINFQCNLINNNKNVYQVVYLIEHFLVILTSLKFLYVI